MDFVGIELANQTSFVNDLYYSDSSNRDIVSNSYREFQKSTFYVPIDEKLEANHSDNSTFKANVSYDELLYVNCRLELPTLKIKEEYIDTVKIAWCHNVGHNIIKTGKFTIDGKEYQKFDKIGLDIAYQFETPNDKKQNYKERIGSIPMLEDWTTHLPRYKLNIPQPFYFCKDISQNVPLKIYNVKEATFNYEFILDIWKLLRVSIFSSKTNSWQELKNLNKQKLEAFVSGIDASAKLPYPEIYARYVQLTDEERNWRSSCLTKQVYYIDQLIDSSPANTYTLSQTAEAQLACNSPCKKIFWMAEKKSNKDFNIFSNYTVKGYNPCSSASMKYQQVVRFNVEQDMSEKSIPDKHCIGTPNEPGYNVYSFSYDTSSYDADIGMSFNPPNNTATLSIKIDDTDPYTEETKKIQKKLNKDDIEEMLQEQVSDNENSSKERYKVHVRLLTYRRIKFEKNEKGEICLVIDNN
jgi:hypothetical protein